MTRTCVEAMAATQGHTQSLHTNALDEALALPTDFSARIARNTQLLLQQESGTTRVIDPWGGSAYVERLTYDLARRAWAHIQEVEDAGGMAKAIEEGMPKLRIEEAAARTQARIDSGRQPVIGVNKYLLSGGEDLDVLKIDNAAVRRQQVEKLQRLRERARRGRLPAGARAAHRGGRTGERRRHRQPAGAGDRRGPRARRRSGRSPTRWRSSTAATPARSGRSAACTDRRPGTAGTIDAGPRPRLTDFEQAEGRRPRILVAKMGQDGHDRGQKVISSAFADLGFDVDVGPLFQTPDEVARQAVEADVHIVGVNVAGRRAPDPGAGAAAGAGRTGPGRHHDRRRRRHPAAGLRRAARGRRGGDLPARGRVDPRRRRSTC